MIVFVLFTLCYLLTGLDGRSLQSCASQQLRSNALFLTCIMGNWKLNEQKILQLSGKLATQEQQNKIAATQQQTKLLELTKRYCYHLNL